MQHPTKPKLTAVEALGIFPVADIWTNVLRVARGKVTGRHVYFVRI